MRLYETLERGAYSSGKTPVAWLAEREHNFIKPGPQLSREQAAFDLRGDSLFTSKGNSFEPEGQTDSLC